MLLTEKEQAELKEEFIKKYEVEEDKQNRVDIAIKIAMGMANRVWEVEGYLEELKELVLCD